MIRALQKADIERVVDIWLDTNLKAHNFIPGQYWKNNIDLVKEMLPQAEVYVYENDCQIEGFIGLNDEYVEGIFVRDEMQSQGIGKLLLNFVKEKKMKLYLNVYQTTLIISKKPGNTGISRDIRTEFTTDLLLSD